MMNKTKMWWILAVIVVAIVAFLAGAKYSHSGLTTLPRANNAGNLAGIRGARGGMSGNLVTGEVLMRDDQSLVVKLRDGGSKIIFLTPTTPVTKTVSGSSEDLKVGEQVMVTGASNTDGSVSAQSVQIRPETIPADHS